VNTIFVYGLLKPGLSLHHVAEPFVLRGLAAKTKGRLYDAGVPAARFDEDGEIVGFVFWLDEARLDEALAVLDDLEDEGVEYRRTIVTAETEEGPVRAQAYEYLKEVRPDRFVGTSWS